MTAAARPYRQSRCGGRENCMTRCLARRLLWVPLLLVLQLAAPVWAGSSDWLLAQRQPGGSIATSADSVGAELATAEAWRALAEAGTASAELDAAAAYVNALAAPSSELLARRLRAQAAAGNGGGTDAVLLASYATPAQGFGYLAGYDSDVASSAWALLALAGRSDVDAALAGRTLGWLQQQQRNDGGWALGAANRSDVYLTAAVLQAAWPYRQRFDLRALMNAAGAYLLAQRNAAGLWADDVDSAMALLALVPLQNPPDALAASVAALQARVDTAGSLGGDVFATALWLRLSRLSTAPQSNPDLGSLRLRVLDAESSNPLGGISVRFEGPTPAAGSSDVAGAFAAQHLAPGEYMVYVTQTGYRALSLHVTLPPGQSIDLGDQALIVDLAQATTGGVRGQITAASSGQPLAGATVHVGTQSIVSDADGNYELRGLPPGNVDLRVELAGFHRAYGTGPVVAGCTMLFNATLEVDEGGGSLPEAAVDGRVTDLASGVALSGALVQLSGANSASATTDADGRYRIAPLQPGATTFTVRSPAHQDATASTTVHEGELIQFSPAMTVAGQPPVEASTRVSGKVIDAVTQRPVVGARVRIDDGFTVHEGVSDGDGDFVVRDVRRGYATLEVVRHEYVDVGFGLAIPPVEQIDAGQLRLRPLHAPQIRPDLRVQDVSAEGVVSAADELTATGSLRVRIDNRFGAAIDREVEVIAFVDIDADRAYDASIDTLLGSLRQRLALTADSAELDLTVPVAGRLPFRDAPIAALVDPADEVAELREENNYGISAGRCRALVPAMDEGRMIEALRWSGDPGLPPEVRMSSATVAVAQLSDDNGDGHIDQRDIPDLVVPVGSGGEHGSWGVVALSGDDLRLLWKFNQLRISQFVAPAVGDIDGDDKVEIALVDARRSRLVVLENDGSLKWAAPTGPVLPCVRPFFCPPDAGDAVLMANFVADERPEIVVNKQVYNAQGDLLWTGAHTGGEYGVLGAHPIAADLDGDGHNELLGGPTVYRNDGMVFWHRDDLPLDAHDAVGNFDADTDPEIVLVTPGQVYLLDHTGATIWGPVLLPGGGGGGPPTIADYDGDGLAEIGVISATAFSVIDGDGTVLWSAAMDDPIGIHSAAVFDFESDGRLEVVYHDHNDLHVVDAVTGVERVRVHNTHLTAFENPVIADLDHDGEAEIILSSTNDWQAQTTGLRVFRSENGPWSAAGDIWNQYDFHIDNVDRNGVVAAVEPPYWQTHNSNRKNTLNDRDPIGRADFSAGAPQLVDRGSGQPPLVRVRVGNAGQPTNAEQVKVALYLGDPAAGGSLLATSAAASVLPGRWRTFDLALPSTPVSGELYAVVDPDQRFAECDESNNVAHRPYLASQPQLSLSLDAPAAVDPGASVALQAQLRNDGATPTRVRIQLWIETPFGEGVATLNESAASELAPQQSLQHTANWSSGNVLSGRYLLRARAVPDGGLPAAEVSREIEIRAVGDGEAVNLRASTQRSEYAADADVRMETVLFNRSANLALQALSLDVEIVAPGGASVFSEQHYLAQLAPGMSLTRHLRTRLIDASAGDYLLHARLRSLADQRLIASDSHAFRVVATPLAALSGRVEHSAGSIAPGDAQECRMHFDNAGSSALTAVPVRLALLRLAEPPGLVASVERTIDVPAGASRSELWSPATAQLAGGEYACAAQIQRDGDWTSLAFSTFLVQARVDLAPTFSALPADVALGARFEPGIALANAGPSAASAVVVDIALPARLAFIDTVSPAGAACSANGTGLRCTLPDLAAGQSQTLVIALRGLSSGPAELRASATAAQIDGNAADNSVSASVAVRPQVNLSAIGQSCYRPLRAGGLARFGATVSNSGPDGATAASLDIGLPPGARAIVALAEPGTCSIAPDRVQCTLGDLAVGATARVGVALALPSALQGPTAWPLAIAATQDEGTPADNSLIVWRSVIGDLLFYDGFDDCSHLDDVLWANGFE